MTTTYTVGIRYEIDGTANTGYRVVAVSRDNRRPYLTRFQQLEHAVEEMQRLKERDAAIRQGMRDGYGQRGTHQGAKQ